MENYSYSSYPDSGNSSPRSREIDCENAPWDDLPPNYRVRFMCSYGGKISPRPHDNQLSYVGGDTKILTVDRNIRFPSIISKLSSLVEDDVCFKYQLPGEDLDALISVTNDEDLDHMMLEYDRLFRATAKPARLRLFLFPFNQPPIASGFVQSPPSDTKSDRQWFVDALNSAPIQASDVQSSPPASSAASVASNQDFLFGFDKASAAAEAVAKPKDAIPQLTVPDVPPIRSDSAKEDRQIGVEPAVSTAEIMRQIHELQRLQIASQEQAIYQRRSDETLPRGYPGDYYPQKSQEKATPPPPPPQTAVTMPIPVQMPSPYWTERQMPPSAGFTPSPATGTDQPVYLVPTPMYRPPVAGQGYYMQRMVPDAYRDPPVYGMGPPPPLVQKMAPYGDGAVRPQGIAMTDAAAGGYTGVAYDSAGRQVYYNAPGSVVPTYHTVTASSVDVRQEGNVAKPPQS